MISQEAVVRSVRGNVKGVPVLVIALLVSVAVFFLKAYLVQWSWNNVVPRLSEENKVNSLEYVDSLYLTLLASVLMSCCM